MSYATFYERNAAGVWVNVDTGEPKQPQPQDIKPYVDSIVVCNGKPDMKPGAVDDADAWYRSCATLEEYLGY
jgi:hypothetical protein